jgi:hypothetical protein
MSDTFSKVEVITGVARRRRFSAELQQIINEIGVSACMCVQHGSRDDDPATGSS